MTNKPRSKTRFILPVLTALSIGVLCAVVIWCFDLTGYRSRAVETRSAIGMTLSELEYVSAWIEIHSKLLGRPPEDAKLLPDYLDKTIPDGNVVELFFHRGWIDPHTRLLIDSWRNPITLTARSPHNYRFLSAGPNGKYESGEGDDIVHDFELEFRDANETTESTQ